LETVPPKRKPPGVWNNADACIPDFNEIVLVMVDGVPYVARFTSCFNYVRRPGRGEGVKTYKPQYWMGIPPVGDYLNSTI